MEEVGRSPHVPESLARHVTFEGRAVEGSEAPTLEGRLSAPQDGALHPAVVLCHANPAAGGSMDMKVMLAIEAALVEAGFATLRYNSRGVGESTGTISRTGDGVLVAPEGAPETQDVGAALDFLAMQQGVDPNHIALVGHSFGGRISLAYLSSHPGETRVQAVVCIGLPVAWRNLAHLGQWECPKLFITGEFDDFSPPEQLAEFVNSLPEPSTLVTLKGTGHFFEGREGDLAAVVVTFLNKIFHPHTTG
ncbi:MAG TPA: alpha/beta fold hydrolase [Chloroflexia bacterium]|nr:alpha/beta fold hydrolase [Chloroflexia bacterium]